MTREEQAAQLRARRRALKFTEEQMAAGIGIRRLEVREIEQGIATDAMGAHYAGWLARMEKWPADVREMQLKLVANSERFRL